MQTLFWVSIFLVALVYAGYPLLLSLLKMFLRRDVNKGPISPLVTILIAAYNEDRVIAQTLDNKLSLNYPRDRIEIIVVSDGSTDRTNSIVRSYADRGVKLAVQPSRLGKTAALNRGVDEASGEIIVFCDANSIYQKDALNTLIENFNDPFVGYVTGKMIYVDEQGSVVGKGCSAYMRYENTLRELETAVGSVVGVDGGIDAVRKSLYEPMRHDLLPDFVLPLQVVDKGYRVVYEPQALLTETTLTTSYDEMKMRVRVILRSFHALGYMKRVLNPFHSGIYSFQLFVHKLLRYSVGLLQLFLLVSNYVLLREGPLYIAIFAAQVFFYSLVASGFHFRRSKTKLALPSYSYYFCLLNAAALLAFWKFLMGEKQVVWQPRKGN